MTTRPTPNQLNRPPKPQVGQSSTLSTQQKGQRKVPMSRRRGRNVEEEPTMKKSLHKLVLTEDSQYLLGIHSEPDLREFLDRIIPDSDYLEVIQYTHSNKHLTAGFADQEEMRVRCVYEGGGGAHWAPLL